MPLKYLEDCPHYDARCHKLTPFDLDRLEECSVAGQRSAREKGWDGYKGMVVIDAFTLEQLVEAAREKLKTEPGMG